jgi:cobalt/nickel transport system permease protein
MAGGHGGASELHHHGDSVVHRLPAEAKIVAAFVFIVAVVVTPRDAMWAFAIDAALVSAAVVAARLPASLVLHRLRIEVPFLAFALFMPIVGRAPRVDVVGVPLSQPGMWAAWNIVVKGSLGVMVAIVLAASTPVSELLAGLERLRAPRTLVAIAGFMVRYLDVIVGEASRMRIARASRCDDPRWLWQGRSMAMSAGTLFVRSYERGERVHLAMLSRGYTGAMPELHEHEASPVAWAFAALLPVCAAAVMLVAVLIA